MSIVGSDETYASTGEAERWKKIKGDYVILALLERAADAVLSKQEAKAGIDLAGSLYNFESFKSAFAGILPDVTLSDLDLKVLLKFLVRDKRAVVRQGEVSQHTCGIPSLSSSY